MFWHWLLTYRRRSLPRVISAITVNARDADVYLLRKPRDARAGP
ncbi:MAG: hypothetical protein ACRDTL_12100 [Mycobacterium sp.]